MSTTKTKPWSQTLWSSFNWSKDALHLKIFFHQTKTSCTAKNACSWQKKTIGNWEGKHSSNFFTLNSGLHLLKKCTINKKNANCVLDLSFSLLFMKQNQWPLKTNKFCYFFWNMPWMDFKRETCVYPFVITYPERISCWDNIKEDTLSLASSIIWMGSGLRDLQSQQRTVASYEPEMITVLSGWLNFTQFTRYKFTKQQL